MLANSETYERSDRDRVPWDVETIGFGWSEETTVSGLWVPGDDVRSEPDGQ